MTPVGRGDDRLQVPHRLRLLDLDHDPGRALPGLQFAAQPGDVVRAADERQPHELHVAGVTCGPVEIVQVLVGQRLDGQLRAGQVQPLPRPQPPGERHLQPGPARGGVGHGHRHGAVGEQDCLAGLEVVRQLAVRAGQFPGAVRGAVGDQGELLTQRALDQVAGDRAEPHLRPAQVLQDADVPARLPAHRPDVGENGGVLLVRPVREVEPEHVDAGLDQPPQDGRRAGGRADRGDDLRADRGQLIAVRRGHGRHRRTSSVRRLAGAMPARPPSSSRAWRIQDRVHDPGQGAADPVSTSPPSRRASGRTTPASGSVMGCPHRTGPGKPTETGADGRRGRGATSGPEGNFRGVSCPVASILTFVPPISTTRMFTGRSSPWCRISAPAVAPRSARSRPGSR